MSISANTSGAPVCTRRAAVGFMFSTLTQRVHDLVGDLVCTEPKGLTRKFLLAGFLEEGIGRSEPDELPRRDPGIDQPFRNRRAKAADPRMLLDGGDQRKAREDIGEAGFVQR